MRYIILRFLLQDMRSRRLILVSYCFPGWHTLKAEYMRRREANLHLHPRATSQRTNAHAHVRLSVAVIKAIDTLQRNHPLNKTALNRYMLARTGENVATAKKKCAHSLGEKIKILNKEK